MFSLAKWRLAFPKRYSALALVAALCLADGRDMRAWAQGEPIKPVARLTYTESTLPLPPGYGSPSEEMFRDPELWWFLDKATMEKIIEEQLAGPYPQLAPLVRAQLRGFDGLSREEQRRLYKLYDKRMLRGGTFMVMPDSVRNQLPAEFLREAYAAQNNLISPAHGVFANLAEIEAFFKGKHRATEEAMAEIRRDTFYIDGKFHVVFTHALEAFIPESAQKEIRAGYDRQYIPENDRKFLKLTLHLSSQDDIAAVAQKIAPPGSQGEVEATLRARLAAAGGQEIHIPVSEFLQPFIQRNMGHFATANAQDSSIAKAPLLGPNCFNTGLCVNLPDMQKNFTDEFALLTKLEENYTYVPPNEALQQGDLLLYVNEKDYPVHVANYLFEAKNELDPNAPSRAIVFTKDGRTRNSPYTFMEQDRVEELYFRNGKYRLIALRPNGAGIAPNIQPGLPKPLVQYYRDTITPRHPSAPRCFVDFSQFAGGRRK